MLPAPGEGPSPQAQQKGRYDLRFFGTSGDGQSLRLKVTGRGDPGYGSTSKMLGQAAAWLALDLPGRPMKGGILTPATVFDDAFLDRLVGHAEMTFEVQEA